MRRGSQEGFTLVEYLVASLATMIVLGAAFTLMNQIVKANTGMGDAMSTRANVRAAMNMITRDITMAGTGLPSGSVTIPNGADAEPIIRPGMGSFELLDRQLETAANVLPIISTGEEDGPSVASETDVLAIFTTSQETPTWSISNIVVFDDRYEVTFSTAVDAGTNQLVPGDLLLFSNNYGSVLGCVSDLHTTNNRLVYFRAADAMGINQPAAENGTIGSIRNPGTDPATYPPTTAMRVSLINYFINNANPSHPQLMRAINAAPAELVADDIESLLFSFDTWDEATSTQNSNVKTTDNPNQIRSVAVSITGRSPKVFPGTSDLFRFSLFSKVNVRNSTFRNRYAGS